MNDIPASVQLEVAPCPLCGGDAPARTLFVGHDMITAMPGEFPVVECCECGLKRTSPRPTIGSIGHYYPADYGPYRSTLVEQARTGPAPLSPLGAFARRIFDTKAHSTPKIPPGKMLEIGCASGSYLHEMATKGWNVEGIELSPDAGLQARKLGLNVEIGAIETIDREPQTFDMIVAWMVLEHFHDPVETLTKVRRWIKSSGTLVVSVPDSGGYELKLFGRWWYALHLPNHLFHYDVKTVGKVFDAAGWRVSRVQHHRNLANLFASTGFWLRDKGWTRLGNFLADFPDRSGKIGTVALFPLAVIAAAAGQTGRMTIWAQPKV